MSEDLISVSDLDEAEIEQIMDNESELLDKCNNLNDHSSVSLCDDDIIGKLRLSDPISDIRASDLQQILTPRPSSIAENVKSVK